MADIEANNENVYMTGPGPSYPSEDMMSLSYFAASPAEAGAFHMHHLSENLNEISFLPVKHPELEPSTRANIPVHGWHPNKPLEALAELPEVDHLHQLDTGINEYPATDDNSSTNDFILMASDSNNINGRGGFLHFGEFSNYADPDGRPFALDSTVESLVPPHPTVPAAPPVSSHFPPPALVTPFEVYSPSSTETFEAEISSRFSVESNDPVSTQYNPKLPSLTITTQLPSTLYNYQHQISHPFTTPARYRPLTRSPPGYHAPPTTAPAIASTVHDPFFRHSPVGPPSSIAPDMEVKTEYPSSAVDTSFSQVSVPACFPSSVHATSTAPPLTTSEHAPHFQFPPALAQVRGAPGYVESNGGYYTQQTNPPNSVQESGSSRGSPCISDSPGVTRSSRIPRANLSTLYQRQRPSKHRRGSSWPQALDGIPDQYERQFPDVSNQELCHEELKMIASQNRPLSGEERQWSFRAIAAEMRRARSPWLCFCHNRKFASKQRLEGHLKTHLNLSDGVYCDLCGEHMAGDLRRHQTSNKCAKAKKGLEQFEV